MKPLNNMNQFLLRWKISFAAICSILVLSGHSVFSQCTTLTPAQMEMSSSEIILGDYPVIDLPVLGSVPFSNGGDPVTGIKILPPDMVLSADDYLPGTHYDACVDAGAGTGLINFNRGGIYFVRINRMSGDNDTIQITVLAEKLQSCALGGRFKEFPCPTPPHSFEGSDTKPGLRFPGSKVVGGVQALVDSVCASAGGGKIDIVIVDHGFPGGISINGENISTAPADSAALRKIGGLKGKVSSICLLSCSSAQGAAGAAFLKKLSELLGGIPVKGSTSDLARWRDSTGAPIKWARDSIGKDTTITSEVKEVKRTTKLLPPLGPFKSLQGEFIPFGGGIMLRNVMHSGWAPIALPPINFGTQFYNFTSPIMFEISLDNGNTWNPHNANSVMQVRVTNLGNTIGTMPDYYETEMIQLDISGGTLPPGVMIRESPTLPSLGRTEIRTITPIDFGIGSFFDVFTELSLNGGANWQPAQSSSGLKVILQENALAIPTMTEWGMIILAGLILIAGAFYIRRMV
jgi:hypothetical protein